ncbi:MAG: F0F1 ATP synthase subunit B [Actinomycetota bacterium]
MAPVQVPGNILLPAGYDIFWSAVALAVIAFVFGRLVLPKFTVMLDERSERIEGGLKAGAEARAEAERLRASFDAELAEARRQAAHIRETANEEARQILAEARQKAVAEAEKITANATRAIEAERQVAEISLRTEVGMLASELASRIVGESLDPAIQSRVIDRFLEELEADVEADAGAEAKKW